MPTHRKPVMFMLRVVSLLIVISGIAAADLVLVEGRLTFDAVASVNARWQQFEKQGFSTRRIEFYRSGVPIGLNGVLSDNASVRFSFDAGMYQGAYDLYIDLHWPNGFGIRAGQFLIPVGLEAMTLPQQADFIERAIVWLNWKPWTSRDADVWDPRDIGTMLRYESSRFQVAAAVINGSGKAAWLRDTDAWKDICGRVAVRPFGIPGTFAAVRGYYGRMGDAGIVFRTLAGEFGVVMGDLRLVGEYQHAVSGPSTRTTCYVKGVYTVSSLLEPAFRFDASFRPNDTDMGLTPGLNLTLAENKLRLMFNYVYRKRNSPNPEIRSTEQQVLLQLQASL